MLIIHSVGNCGSGRLIDYAVYIQARNCTGILCSPTLIIIEVGRNSNNRIIHFFSQIGLGSRLHLLKDHGRNFFRSELRYLSIRRNLDKRLVFTRYNLVWHQLLVGLNRLIRVVTTDETLYIKYGVLRVDGGLVFGCISNETLAILGEGNVRWSDSVALIVCNDINLAILVDSNA
mmetsp:Transcript_12607/g.18878  ORF Transcript_12607/g.18878 Transcript_12607/m.18878 type:complete len:175 (-) Transcript_12607:360-884(-)